MSEAPVSQNFTGEWIGKLAIQDDLIAARDAIIAEMTATIAELHSDLCAAEYNIRAKEELLDAVMRVPDPLYMSPTMQDEIRWPRPRPMAADCGPCDLCARLDCVLNPKSGKVIGGLDYA